MHQGADCQMEARARLSSSSLGPGLPALGVIDQGSVVGRPFAQLRRGDPTSMIVGHDAPDLPPSPGGYTVESRALPDRLPQPR